MKIKQFLVRKVRHKKVSVKRLLLLLILLGGTWWGLSRGLAAFDKIEGRLLLRDFVMTTYAHIRAGDNIPIDLEKIEYARAVAINPMLAWNIKTNSIWLADTVREIVPYFSYEGITEMTLYPVAIAFVPKTEFYHFHHLGQAGSGIVTINESILFNTRWNDQRLLLSTIIHELAHIQGGMFVPGPPFWLFQNDYEARAQSATIEILAAMCNHGEEIACKSFWSEVEGYARGSFRMRLRRWKLEQLYDPIANIFWRDAVEQDQADKSMRYWYDPRYKDRKRYLYELIYAYQQRPWEDHVVQGVLGGYMWTGFQGECEPRGDSYVCKPMKLIFDDTARMFRGLPLWLIRYLWYPA